MRKIILSLGAILTMGIASAQTDPKQPAQVPQTPPPPKTELKAKQVKDAEIQKDAVTKQPKKEGEVQPLKDEMKTHDHVKSTSKVKDTIKTVKKITKSKKS